MGSNGGVFKRCGCRDPRNRRLAGSGCPALAERGHGSWYVDCTVAGLQGRPDRVRRGGYPTRREALAARDALLNPHRSGQPGQAWTVARWLRHWLTSRTSIRPSTLRSYQHHVDAYLVPHLGRLQLDELTGRHVTAMFRTLAAADTGRGRPPAPGTSSCPGRVARTPRCGRTNRSPPGASRASDRSSRSGPRNSWPRSSPRSPKIGSIRCGG
jgi:Phage integrase, N-terminal SAM-like domain